MNIKSFCGGFDSNFTYLIWDESNEAAIIDASNGVHPILDFAEENGLKIKYVFLMHSHFDHLEGVEEYRKKGIEILGHESMSFKLDKKLKDGDILNIDVTVIRNGWHGDTSKMFLVGKTQPHNERLVRVTQECLYKAIEVVKPGAYLGDIGAVIQEHAQKNHYSVVEDYCGHGIGEVFHELPQVIHYDDGKISQSPILEPGMTFTIEPMVNLGGYEVITSRIDGWTVTTKDRSLSAQTEHTILVTENGYEVLTLRDEELNQ